MKGLAITNRGIEAIASLEISKLIKSKSKIEETVCIFNIKKIEDLALLCYKGQSFTKVIYLMDNFKFKNLNEIGKKLIKINELNRFIKKNKKFKVNCKRVGEHDFNSVDVEKLVTKNILKDSKLKVDFDGPDLIIYAYINENNFYLGMDFSGFDLSKRDYRIFLHPAALKATLAYALLRVGDYNKSEVLLDPFCGSGTICIEAALFASDFPVNYHRKNEFAFQKFLKFNFKRIDEKFSEDKLRIYGYDHLLRNIKASQKNAKIAGIFKKIKFSKISVDWLDIKFEENSIDRIITHPPAISKNNEKAMEQLYKEFFHQAGYILKKDGLIVIIAKEADLIKKIAEENKFRLKKEKEVWQGQQCLKVLVLSE